jgi:hypothetical protein
MDRRLVESDSRVTMLYIYRFISLLYFSSTHKCHKFLGLVFSELLLSYSQNSEPDLNKECRILGFYAVWL